ncbi:hypothetical protein M0805_008296 [Coniferiporia weirii]|nr:hypothetical protein M0805_008296 [Coniferiporia weirii]
MDQYISPELLAGGNPKQQQQQLQQTAANLDFLSFTNPSDIITPHPDLFESELDLSLAGFDPLQLQSFLVDDTFNFLRTDTPTCGPPSTFTVSSKSASAYESLSSYSESFYNYAPSTYSFDGLDMDFRRASINAHQDYVAAAASQNTASGLSSSNGLSEYAYGTSGHSPASSGTGSVTTFDEHDSYGTLPPSPVGHQSGSVYSDYGSDYYPPVGSNHPSLGCAGVVSPRAITSQQALQIQRPQARAPSPVGAGLGMSLLPRIARNDSRHSSQQSSSSRASAQLVSPPIQEDDEESADGKRFKCKQCPRRFTRAFNLKTHLLTHDPNRTKPYICPRDSCGRSFSRKHDLSRHIVSLHRDDPRAMPSSASASGEGASDSEVSIGVANLAERSRCDSCGVSVGITKCPCSAKVK